MLIGRDSTGKAQEIRTNENGNLEVVVSGGSGTSSSETTLNASIQTVGTTATTINVNKKVTSIDIANYSESANVTVGVGTSNFVIGSSVATSLAINKDVTTISLTSTKADTKVQIVVKVAEESQDGGGDDSGDDEESLTPITENMDFNNLVLPPSLSITLSKNILDYFDSTTKEAMEEQIEADDYFTYTFYMSVYIPAGEDYETADKKVNIEEISLNYLSGRYFMSLVGSYINNEAQNQFRIDYSSSDGINFYLSSAELSDGDNTIIPHKIEFPVILNFSEMVLGSEESISQGWNDVLSEFLFTENN